MTVLTLDNVKKVLKSGQGKPFVLHISSLQIEKGKVYAVMGPNGSGKSTLSRVLSGVTKPDRGNVLICGKFPVSTVKGRARISYLPERGYLYPEISVDGNIAIYVPLLSACYNQDSRSVRRKVYEVLELLEFKASDFKKNIKALSAGTKRKVEVALALGVEAALYLLDMPTEGLDPSSRYSFISEISRMMSEKGHTIFMSTHIPDEASAAEVVYFIKQGELIAEISPTDIHDFLSNVVVLRYSPPEYYKVKEATKAHKAKVGDTVARIYNVSVSTVERNLKSRGVNFAEMYEISPNLSDLYTYLTGDTLEEKTAR